MSGSSAIHLLESKRTQLLPVKFSYILFLFGLILIVIISLMLSNLAGNSTSLSSAKLRPDTTPSVSAVTVNGQTVKLSGAINYSHNFTSRGSNVSVSVYSHNSSSGNSAASAQSSVVVSTN